MNEARKQNVHSINNIEKMYFESNLVIPCRVYIGVKCYQNTAQTVLLKSQINIYCEQYILTKANSTNVANCNHP